jgi:DNA-binding transcriptional LysR family regulator
MTRTQRDATIDLGRFLPYRLSVLTNLVSSAIADAYRRRFVLSIPEWRVLAVLARHPGRSATEVSELTRMDAVAVSRAVARLEERLGVRLLHRTSRRVSATDEGARLLARAAPLLDQLRDVLEDAAGRDEGPAGRLRVTAPLATGAERVGRALIAFAAAHPRLTVDLRLTNSVLSLVEEGLDLAFRAGPIVEAEVVARRLWAIPYALAASPAVIARAGGLVPLECTLGTPEGRELFAVYPSRRLVPRRVRDAIAWVQRDGPPAPGGAHAGRGGSRRRSLSGLSTA